MRRRYALGTVLLLAWVTDVRGEDFPGGIWLSEKRTEVGMGKTLEMSGDGRIRLSLGVAVGQQWVLQETRKKRHLVQLLDPATGKKIRTVELQVDPKTQQLTETDLATGETLTMAFVSQGKQASEPPFLGRWQFMLSDFGILAVYDYSEDGWVWLRAPIQADLGTYTVEGNRILPRWPGTYPPLTEISIEGEALIATTGDGATERFLPPKLLETLTSQAPGPRR